MTRPPGAVLGPGAEPAEDDHVLGNLAAPVTVLEYGDYECPYCAAAAPVLLRLVEESDGGVRLVFRNCPIADRHPYALTAALAAEAAGAQGAFWPMHEVLFARQDRLDDTSLRKYAEELGLDPDRVVGEPAQPFADKVEADFASGLTAGVAGTPTVFVDGRQFSGRVEIGALRRAVMASSAPAAESGVADESGVQPRARRQRWWSGRVRGAQREALAQDPQQDDAQDRREN